MLWDCDVVDDDADDIASFKSNELDRSDDDDADGDTSPCSVTNALPSKLSNRWRGFQPWPGAFTTLDGKKLIVHKLQLVPAQDSAQPGDLRVEGLRLFVACAHGTALELLEVQPEGKNHMKASEFLRGNQIASGTRLG